MVSKKQMKTILYIILTIIFCMGINDNKKHEGGVKMRLEKIEEILQSDSQRRFGRNNKGNWTRVNFIMCEDVRSGSDFAVELEQAYQLLQNEETAK